MDQVKRMGERAAKSSIPILITGESGVGKELIARAVHGGSDRAGKPFVAVNCGAIPENLVEIHPVRPREGQLHRRPRQAPGQVPGSQRRHPVPRRGRRAAARHAGQAAARPAGGRGRPGRLQALGQGRRAHRLGHQPRPGRTGEGQGRFREDLYYRLNVFPIEAPALRDRREDIPALVEHFIRRFNVEEGKRVAGATAETLALLMAYDWPGNVRQLENAVYRAIVLADAPYPAAARLPGHLRPDPAGGDRAERGGLGLGAAALSPSVSELLADLPKDAPVRSSTTAATCARWKTSSAT